jgi:ADP-ribose pyrophosphatase YjhB (NUDIX family)
MQKIKRLYINLIHHLLKLWWFLTRPEGRGVKVLLKHGDEILLARHSYGHRLWTIPGGGVKKAEDFAIAGRREITEEMGITVNNLVRIGSYNSDYEYKKVTVECFVAEVDTKTVTPDDFEIAEVGWFPITSLPTDRASSVDRIIKFYENQQS